MSRPARRSRRSTRALVACAGLAILGWASPSGCGAGTFQCQGASECELDGRFGTCEANGYCSFPDETCDSGQRYGEGAPAGLAGECVPVDSGTTGGSTPVGPTSAQTQGGSSGGGGSTDGLPPLDGTDATSTGVGPGPGESTTTSTSASTDTMPPASTSEGSSSSETGPAVMVLGYPAVLTGCNDPMNLDPALCEAQANPSPGAMMVDGEDMLFGPFHSFIRFDLDGAVVPDDVVAITLRLTVTDDMSADGPSSGEVYEVEPFDLAALTMLQPAPVGMLLAPDQGAVLSGDTVEWPLPPDLLDGGEPSLYLGVFALDTNGIDYWAATGMHPPELIVEQAI